MRSCTIGLSWFNVDCILVVIRPHGNKFGGHLSELFVRLKEERNRLGLTQTAFGALAGVSKDAQLNYERGVRVPDAAYLAQIAAAGVDVLYLLTGRRTPRHADGLGVAELSLLDSFTKADPAGRAALQAVAAIACRSTSTVAAAPSTTVNVGGDVGQSVSGDQVNHAPVSFNVGRTRK